MNVLKKDINRKRENMAITKENLQNLFEYKEGNLYWKVNQGLAKIGDLAGGTPDPVTSYRKVMIQGVSYRLHRLIWAFHNDSTSENITFKDGNRENTKIENLRIVTKSDTLRARRKFKQSTSQYKGVYLNKKNNRWVSQIKHQNKTVYIGSYPDELHAHEAWLKKAKELGIHSTSNLTKETPNEELKFS
jgi:hypothetical protein